MQIKKITIMNSSEELDVKILEFLDGTMNKSEREGFEKFIQTNEVAKNRFVELEQIHLLLKTNAVEQPSKNFTQNVMANLDKQPFYGNLSILNSVLLLAGIIVVVGLCAFFVSKGFFDSTTSIDINGNEYIQKYSHKTIPVIDLSGKLMVNTIIILNLALGFMILDRAILKPLFQRRTT
jgi:hypothetical protein